MDIGHLPLLAWLSGTHCTRTCGIRSFLMTVTGSHWRRFYLHSSPTSVFSALEVFFTRMRYTNPHYFDIRHSPITCQVIRDVQCSHVDRNARQIRWWNFENRLTFARVATKHQDCPVFWLTLYNHTRSVTEVSAVFEPSCILLARWIDVWFTAR